MTQFLSLLFLSSMIFVSIYATSEISISYNDEIGLFESSDCTQSNIKDYFDIDSSENIYLECSCDSTIESNEDGLFEGLSEYNTYLCETGEPDEEEEEDCSCLDIEEIEIEPQNNWSASRTVRALKMGNLVKLNGFIIHNSNSVLNVCFTLPVGFRPRYTIVHPQMNYNYASYGSTRVRINTDVTVEIVKRLGDSMYSVLLDEISFFV
jgi:hypothetical protein